MGSQREKYIKLAEDQRVADLLCRMGEPFHYPCGKPYTVEVTIEGIAPLLMQRFNPGFDRDYRCNRVEIMEERLKALKEPG